MARKKAIGIDLGTSKCCVGIFRNCKVEILENERGNKTTPSYVAFTDTERLVGEDAKDQATLNPVNTVFGAKRIIGRELKDGLLEKAVNKMPYTIMSKSEEETCIRVSYKDTKEFLLPQQITAILLGKMKDVAEHHLKNSVEEAVISVPASFSNAQRQATKDAAAIAGLKVLALINEPTAAAIAYEANRRKTNEENVAVVDFGAGKLDVAIVTVRRGRIHTRAVSGSIAIGGDDIDEVLMEYVSKKYEDKYKNKLPESPAITERLRSCCENLKRKLTLLPKVQETLDCFGDDLVLPVTINREDLKAMMPEVMPSQLRKCLRRAIQASCILEKDVSRVVLVGGSSRIPLFQTWLEEEFGLNSLDKSVNPDEAVAYGATLYAALLCGDNELDEFTVKDCVPNDYCFSSKGDSNIQSIYEQHSSGTLPLRRVFSFNEHSPFNEKTRTLTFELHEELSGQKNPHRLIGTLCLEDEFRQAVSLITTVTFEIDRCGIFNAIVQLGPNHPFPDVVKNYSGKLGKDQLKLAVEREQQFRRDDQEERERVEAMSRLEALSFRLQSAMGDNKAKKLFPELVQEICNKVEENLQWLDATNTVPKKECGKREKSLEKLNNNLTLQLLEHDKEECKRVAAVKWLNDNIVELSAFLSRPDVSGEGKLAVIIERQVDQTKRWLELTETPSTSDCNERGESLDKLRYSLENKLEGKRQEIERLKAMKNLEEYCIHLEAAMVENENLEVTSGLTKQLIERGRAAICWMNSMDGICSKADCDKRKAALKELYDRAAAERAAIVEAERAIAVVSLKSRCNHLRNNLLKSKACARDPKRVERLKNEVDNALAMLSRGNLISKDECIAKMTLITDLEKTAHESIEESKRTEAKRVATQKTFESEASKIKSSLLNKESREVDFDLVRQISLAIDDLSKWLKLPNQFSEEEYNGKISNVESFIEILKGNLAEARRKTLTEKSHSELNSFDDNSASANGRQTRNGAHKHSASEDLKNKSTYEGTNCSNDAATALQMTGTADTHRDGGKKRSFSNGFGLLN